jgi:hypothetical protein
MDKDSKITIFQAYKAMFEFLNDVYYREGQPDNLGSFLSDLQILKDGSTADPAAWEGWSRVIEKIISEE